MTENPVIKPQIVEKRWGREVWIAVTAKYAGKVIEINKGMSTTLAFHNKKDESLFLDRGELEVELTPPSASPMKFTMMTGDALDIPAGTIHRVTARENCRLIEVSTPELDDIERLEGKQKNWF